MQLEPTPPWRWATAAHLSISVEPQGKGRKSYCARLDSVLLEDMELNLTQGKIALIDDADWLTVSLFKWHAKKSGDRWYACARAGLDNHIRMHRLILNAPPGSFVDHIDGNGLNNRRSNLRLCTNAENQQNTASRPGSSRFKGVAWYSRYGKWRVAFNWNGKTHHVGYFDDEIAAAQAYNNAILPLVGRFARLNVIPSSN